MFLFKMKTRKNKKENKTKQNKNLFLLQIDTCSRHENAQWDMGAMQAFQKSPW